MRNPARQGLRCLPTEMTLQTPNNTTARLIGFADACAIYSDGIHTWELHEGDVLVVRQNIAVHEEQVKQSIQAKAEDMAARRVGSQITVRINSTTKFTGKLVSARAETRSNGHKVQAVWHVVVEGATGFQRQFTIDRL